MRTREFLSRTFDSNLFIVTHSVKKRVLNLLNGYSNWFCHCPDIYYLRSTINTDGDNLSSLAAKRSNGDSMPKSNIGIFLFSYILNTDTAIRV